MTPLYITLNLKNIDVIFDVSCPTGEMDEWNVIRITTGCVVELNSWNRTLSFPNKNVVHLAFFFENELILLQRFINDVLEETLLVTIRRRVRQDRNEKNLSGLFFLLGSLFCSSWCCKIYTAKSICVKDTCINRRKFIFLEIYFLIKHSFIYLYFSRI